MMNYTGRRVLINTNNHRLFKTVNTKSIASIRNTMSTKTSASTSTNNNDAVDFPVGASISSKLMSSSLKPTFLNVINESNMHNVPKNSETHFKVVVVSKEFDEMPSLVKRHRMVNTILSDELAGPVHALSIVAKSIKQWEKMAKDFDGEENIALSPSPNCHGGDGSLPRRS